MKTGKAVLVSALDICAAGAILGFALLRVPGGLAQAPAEQEATGELNAVVVSGSKRFTPEQIIAASGLRVGERVRREDFQAAANLLAQLGVFEKVQFRFSSQGEKVKVEFQVEEAPAVPVSFDNFPWATDGELTQALKNSVTLFDGKAPLQGTILDAMAQALEKLLGTRGVHGTVERALVERPDGEGQVQRFRVEGASLNVGGVDFTDALARNDLRVQERVADLVGKPYSRYAVEVFNIEQVRPIYLERGHLRVRFGRPEARFGGDPTKPLADTVVVIDPIDLGPVYSWGGVTWGGNQAVPSDVLDHLIELRVGDPADGMKLQAAWERVRAEYSMHGYLDAKVEPAESFDDRSLRATYRVAVTEGLQYRMGELVITNLSLDAERRVREAWRMPRGAVFDRTYFEEFLQKGVKEALKDIPVHYAQIGRWLRTNPQTATVDVLIDFE